MSWTWRKPRVSVQPNHGWQAPHQLVDDYAARGVEIAKLNGILIQTEHNLAASRAEIRNLNAHVLDLHGRIERQADVFEEYQARIDMMRRERDDARAELNRLRPVIDLARSWRSYYHAPDPDPEVWARLESALGHAIDGLSKPAEADDGWAEVVGAGFGVPEARQP